MTALAHPRPDRYAPEPSSRAVVTLALLAALLGVLAGQLSVSGHGIAVVGFAVLALPVLFWRRPDVAPACLLVAAIAIEQFGYTVGPRAGAYTAQIPLFHGLAGGVHISPADVLLFMLLSFYVAKSGTGVVRPLPRSPVGKAMLGVVGATFYGVLIGKLHHGQTRIAFTEIRPYAYLAITFVLAATMITRRSSLRLVLWGLALTIAMKAVQGLMIFKSVRHLAVRPDAVLGHEDALFFALYFLLLLALWLFDVPGRLRTVMTWLAPVVLMGDLANTRRAAWLILGVGFITMLLVAYVTLPARRVVVGRVLLALVVSMAVYMPLFWNKSGGLAQPARAVHSAVKPSTRDASSDLYRIQEDENLWVNIQQGKVVGKGFGVPIDYALPIEDISDIDPLITYIPHNGVLYILMRMGIVGAIAFWSLLGCALVAACRLARNADRELAAIGALVASVVVAYSFEGKTDQGFFFYRVAFVVGTLLGALEAARRFAERADDAAAEAAA